MFTLEQKLLLNPVATAYARVANMDSMDDDAWWDRNAVWVIGVILALVGAPLWSSAVRIGLQDGSQHWEILPSQ